MTPPTTHATSNWLATQARFRPRAEALYDVGTGRRWSWLDLHRDSLAWAARLQADGVEKGDRVAVLALNRGETFALLFACAELGAVLFPMNWRLSPDELRWQLDNSGARVVFADDTHLGLDVGRPLSSLETGPDADPSQLGNTVGSQLADPWVIMYTSGSTGRPKGALLTHQQVHWNAINTVLACDLDTSSATLTFTPLFHTGGLNCLSTPMFFRGGRVVLTPRLDAAEALALVVQERISHLMGVPTIYQMLADHPDFDAADLSCVRDALCGGAPLGLPLLERYHARGIPLRQGFGMTEVGPNCFSMPGERSLEKMRGTGDPTEGPAGSCVGLPIPFIGMRLVRPDGRACAPGEPGELLLSGPVVCAGYWNNPEATAKSIQHGWFSTGDVLSRDREGFFYVRGRLKEMFISGGENVYPAEVESAIQQHPSVALAAVVGVPDARWGEVGRAFVELHPGATLDTADLKAALRDRLARFKIPKHVDITQSGGLPRTGSGKLDKKTLAALPLAATPLL